MSSIPDSNYIYRSPPLCTYCQDKQQMVRTCVLILPVPSRDNNRYFLLSYFSIHNCTLNMTVHEKIASILYYHTGRTKPELCALIKLQAHHVLVSKCTMSSIWNLVFCQLLNFMTYNPSKKMMFSALKKMANHGVNWDFSGLNVGNWAVQGSWVTLSDEKMALHAVALKKTAIHCVNWHFSVLLCLALSFFTWGLPQERRQLGSRVTIVGLEERQCNRNASKHMSI